MWKNCENMKCVLTVIICSAEDTWQAIQAMVGVGGVNVLQVDLISFHVCFQRERYTG